jgi:chaperonin cofactor prefoldin
VAFILINGTNHEVSQEVKDYLENLLKRINELESEIKFLSEEIEKLLKENTFICSVE